MRHIRAAWKYAANPQNGAKVAGLSVVPLAVAVAAIAGLVGGFN